MNQSLKDVSVSQEVRIASQHGGGLDLGGRLDWVRESIISGIDSCMSYPWLRPCSFRTNLRTFPDAYSVRKWFDVSKAAFAHAEYTFNEEWSASIGGRQTWDHKGSRWIYR